MRQEIAVTCGKILLWCCFVSEAKLNTFKLESQSRVERASISNRFYHLELSNLTTHPEQQLNIRLRAQVIGLAIRLHYRPFAKYSYISWQSKQIPNIPTHTQSFIIHLRTIHWTFRYYLMRFFTSDHLSKASIPESWYPKSMMTALLSWLVAMMRL